MLVLMSSYPQDYITKKLLISKENFQHLAASYNKFSIYNNLMITIIKKKKNNIENVGNTYS